MESTIAVLAPHVNAGKEKQTNFFALKMRMGLNMQITLTSLSRQKRRAEEAVESFRRGICVIMMCKRTMSMSKRMTL